MDDTCHLCWKQPCLCEQSFTEAQLDAWCRANLENQEATLLYQTLQLKTRWMLERLGRDSRPGAELT